MPIHKDAPYSELHSSKVVGTNDNIVSITDNIAVDSGIALADLDVRIFTRDDLTTTVTLFNSGDTVDLDGALNVNVIREHTADNGVDIDGVDILDGDVYGGYLSASLGVYADTIDEYTADTGVTVDGVLLKDSTVYTDTIDDNGAGYITVNEPIAMGTKKIGYDSTKGLYHNSDGNLFLYKNAYIGYGVTDQSTILYWINKSDNTGATGILDFVRQSTSGGAAPNSSIISSIRNEVKNSASATAQMFEDRVTLVSNTAGAETCHRKWLQRFGGDSYNKVLEVNIDGTIDVPFGLKVDDITEYTSSNGITLGDGGTTDYMSIANDGSVTLYGDARYDCDIQIPVGAVSALGASAASFVSRGLNGAWEYGDNLVRQTSATAILRDNMDRTVAPTLRVFWESPTTSETCKWQLDYIYRKANEDMSSTSGSTVSADGTSSATANGQVYTDFSLAAPDSDDTLLVMRLTRNGSDAGDTLSASAYTHGGKIMYKANKL